MTKILVTGACGFIGSHFVEHVLLNTDWEIVILDKLTYASLGFSRIREIGCFSNPRVKVYTYDLQYALSPGLISEIGTDVDYIIHMAAETHVDNSIHSPVETVHNNIMSTVYMLEYARLCKGLKSFFYFGTDEVYGPALNGRTFTEDDRHNPKNPYSASKSGAEQICVAYHNTYGVPVIRLNVMNAFGERQHVEKFIPKTIKNVLEGNLVHIHSYPDKKTSGTRIYIHARNIAAGVLFLIKNGIVGEVYNMAGEKEISNLDIALFIAKTLGKELKYEMVDNHTLRPGHDLRYSLDGSKMEALGWKLPVDFEDSLRRTILWTASHSKWLEEI